MKAYVARRLIDQVNQAVALAYGLAHASTLASYSDFVALALILVLLVSGVLLDALRRRERAYSLYLQELVKVAQSYVTYILAYLLRLRFSSLFVSDRASFEDVVAPLIIVLVVTTLAVVAKRLKIVESLARHYESLGLLDRFVGAFALSYGLDAHVQEERVSLSVFSALLTLLAVVSFVRSRLSAVRYEALAQTLRRLLSFVEQYTLFVLVRLTQQHAIDRLTSTLHVRYLVRLALSVDALHEVFDPFIMLVVLIFAFTVFEHAYYGNIKEAPTSRRFADRFVNAVAVSSALVHSTLLSRSQYEVEAIAVLAVALITVYLLEQHLEGRVSDVRWRFVVNLVRLVELYVSYTLVRLATLRYAHVGTQFSAAVAVRPLAAVALLLLVRDALTRLDSRVLEKREVFGEEARVCEEMFEEVDEGDYIELAAH